jgi:hypothetical protein
VFDLEYASSEIVKTLRVVSQVFLISWIHNL